MTWDATGAVLIVLSSALAALGAVPGFLRELDRRVGIDRTRAAGRATLVSLVVIVGFALVSYAILSALGVDPAAVVGGCGLILAAVALNQLGDRRGDEPLGRDRTGGGSAWWTPLTAPAAVPGAVAAVIVSLGEADGRLMAYLAVGAAIVTANLVYFAILRFPATLLRLLGVGGISLLGRIVGLLIAIVAVQLLADSIRGFVEGA